MALDATGDVCGADRVGGVLDQLKQLAVPIAAVDDRLLDRGVFLDVATVEPVPLQARLGLPEDELSKGRVGAEPPLRALWCLLA